MTRNGSIWMLAAALAFVGPRRARARAAVSEARIQELIKQAAERVARGQLDAGQHAARHGQPTAAEWSRLTLDDAVKFALDRNLDIAVQRLNPQINDIAIASIRSVYHPSLTSMLGTQSTTTPSTSTLAGGTAGGRCDRRRRRHVQRRRRAEHSVGRRLLSASR